MSVATQSLDSDDIKQQAAGHWCGILRQVCGLSDEQLNPGVHQPCPSCGGIDRFRAFDDVAETGGVICNQCHDKQNSDGFATIKWQRNCSFPEAVELVADALGQSLPDPQQSGTATKADKPKKIHRTCKRFSEDTGQTGTDK
jgi:phage/plasmid primase-like uncharacterized protein